MIKKSRYFPLVLGMTLIFVAPVKMVSSSSYIDLDVWKRIDGSVDVAETQVLDSTNRTDERFLLQEPNHKQRGLLLGLIPISFNIKTINHTDGQVEVRTPWYSFLIIE